MWWSGPGDVDHVVLQVGSFALTVFAAAAIRLIAKQRRSGWLMTAAEQFAWAAYGFITLQYSFILSAAWYFYWAVYSFRNWWPLPNAKPGAPGALLVEAALRVQDARCGSHVDPAECVPACRVALMVDWVERRAAQEQKVA